jgi:hypothetical protein
VEALPLALTPLEAMQSSYPNKVAPLHLSPYFSFLLHNVTRNPTTQLAHSCQQDPQELRAFLARFGVIGTLSTQVP